MSNILNHNRLPLECKLSYKDYWDFCLRVGREYYGFHKGFQTECLAAYIDTSDSHCVNFKNGRLFSIPEYVYDGCKSNGIVLDNFGMTAVDNGRITFLKNEITDEAFNELIHSSHEIIKDNCTLSLIPVNGNNGIYTYAYSIDYYFPDMFCARFNGGFVQNFFRVGDGCDYSILPSDIGNGLSLEFVLYRKDFESQGYTLNDASEGRNKGIFFYIGTRAENKWVRYYGDKCLEDEPEKTDLETEVGVPIDEYIPELTESDNKFLIYSRVCDGTTVLNDKGDETVFVESSPVEYKDNLFTVFSRKCGGITTLNFKEDYLEKGGYDSEYNVYKDLWNNALAFQIKDDNSVGYKYLVKDCEAENPSCAYKIESEFSKPGNVPYAEWTTVHVRILPSGEHNMRLLFYVDGRLVLYSKELPKLNLRELNDLSEKQEGVPFNISLGGGTQGLADVVYEDFRTFHETDYPLQREFAGSFIGYIKIFRFYSCPLNYNQIQENAHMLPKPKNEDKIYCGAIIFNTKPSKTLIEQQADIIPMLNEYPNDTEHMEIRLLPDITKKYLRLVVAIPSECRKRLTEAVDKMNGLSGGEMHGVSILSMFDSFHVEINGVDYSVWYYTYATRPQYNNIIEIQVG